MKLNILIKTGLTVLVALIVLAGCATNMPQKTRRYVWPLPPDTPKIEWVKSYYGENDFPKSGFTVFVETVFGRVRPILFQKPIDIKSNGKGIVYVTDIVLSGIFVFDLPNQKVDFWPKGADPDAGLAISPYFIALDDNGNVYAVGTGRKEIFVLAPSGRLISSLPSSPEPTMTSVLPPPMSTTTVAPLFPARPLETARKTRRASSSPERISSG